jgi:signal transduction histidine kinase
VLGESGYALLNLGNYPRSLQVLLAALSIAEDPKSEKSILPAHFPATDDFTDRSVSPRMQRLATWSRILLYMGILYSNSENYEKALTYYRKAIQLAKDANNDRVLIITYLTIGRSYFSVNQQDSALVALQTAYDLAMSVPYHRYLGSILLNLGRVYQSIGKKQTALEYFWTALKESTEHDYVRGIIATHLELADIYKEEGIKDSTLFHIKIGLSMAYRLNAPALLLRSYAALADFYKNAGNWDSTVKYQSLIIAMNDSIFNSKQVQQFQNIDFSARQQQQEIQAAKEEYQDRIQKNLLIAGLAVFLLAALFLWRSNRQRKKSNAILTKQNNEIAIAMANLKTTQAQLIQAEKMASLGALTTGIAHEIQNPLNFVNNFSELNSELITELEQELENGNTSAAKAIAKDIRENEEKINTQGRRADSIVKSMLQHSRSSKGINEPTDINKLAEEHLRLAYHGWKAKDKSFPVLLTTHFDESIGKINVIPQDIGRVLLNLYMNACYAVTEKRTNLSGSPSPYEPMITVRTKKNADNIEITVEDNGVGISPEIVGKIFQPFFTTKPTGQGTGLGLSLAYDIIKAHGGEIKVETQVGEGSQFIIQLPVAGGMYGQDSPG